MIPYGHQSVDEGDIESVAEALKSDFLTQGDRVEEFEEKLAKYCGAKFAVVMSNGTAALHSAFFAAGLSEGDEFIPSPMTFAATANAGLYLGARPVFVDVDLETGNIDVNKIEEKITEKTKVIVPIDYTGRPAELEKIKEIAEKNNLVVIEDACQALGASYLGKKVGSISDLTVFSFHPVKSITTGEGGAVLTDNEEYYKKMKRFVNHGITKKDFVNESPGEWYSEMIDLGMNYRLTDLQCALGISQLAKLDNFIEKRIKIAERYNEAFKNIEGLSIPLEDDDVFKSAWHLYTVRIPGKRDEVFKKLRDLGIGVQVHHIPVYYHPYYKKLGYEKGLCPNSEKWYETVVSLPIFPDLSETDQQHVIDNVRSLF